MTLKEKILIFLVLAGLLLAAGYLIMSCSPFCPSPEIEYLFTNN